MCCHTQAARRLPPRYKRRMPDLPPRHNTAVADASRGNWIDRLLPEPAKPYARLARLDRPIGWWLLLWPCWWSSVMATSSFGIPPLANQMALFLVGAIAMRGAGCTWNDILDRDLDAEVARTRSRPLPSGQVSTRNALIFLVVQCLIGLVVLLQFNRATIQLGLLSLAIVAIYPLTKRFVDWPQLFLGICFSWGALLGWSAFYATLAPAAFFLYGGGILWTIGYDTIYAHQDREDDALIGVHSTALLFGTRTRAAVAVLYAGATILFGLAFYAASLGLPAYISLGAGALHLAWQVWALDIDDPDMCLAIFKSNQVYGWIIFGGLLVEGLGRLLN
jgi:4-hydroxybenzoate polyprenyltransferase